MHPASTTPVLLRAYRSRRAALLLSLVLLATGCEKATRQSTPAPAPATHQVAGTITPAVLATGDTVVLSGAADRLAVADAAGAYAFAGLADGDYTVTPQRVGQTFAPLSRDVVVGGADIDVAAFTASPSVAPTWPLGGKISGAGVSGVLVTLGGSASGTTSTNASGNFGFTGLADGSYTVTPSRSGFTYAPASRSVDVSGGPVTSVDFTGTALTWSISGTISGAGTSGAQVALGGAATAATSTNGAGQYSFSGLANGSYTVTPTLSGFAYTPASRSINVSGASVTNANFTGAVQTWSISGTLTGSGASGALVTLSGAAASASTTTNGAGQYSFSGLANGSYTVTPALSGYTYTPVNRTVVVNGANVTGANFTGTASPVTLFFDDFTGASLDTAWIALTRHGDYSNSEVQCYLPANVGLSGGYLRINSLAQSQSCGDAFHSATTSNVTSGMVQWRTRRFTYGTVEFRATMAGGQGTWPAVWMLGANCEPTNPSSADNSGNCQWPAAGSDEIDITEIKLGALTTVHQNVISGNSGFQSCSPTVSNVSTNEHLYQLVWSPGRLEWKIDGVSTCVKTSQIPSTPMFLIINTAMGGQGGTVNTSTLPQTLSVDYVKVTQP